MERLTASQRFEDLEAEYCADGVRLYRALLGFSGDRSIAEEALAESYARALSASGRIRHLTPWLWTVAFRVASEELSRRRRIETFVDREVPPPEPPELVLALGTLPERQRAAVILHYFADLSLAEIARILGISPATVGVHLHRGRARLRTQLEDRDDRPS